ncbi:MAG: MBL fold metallo-hydrolase [Clostridia bacterium]
MTFSPLCSGSSGNAAYLEAGGVQLLIDAGGTGKHIIELLHEIDIHAHSIDAILVTHEHSDHICGVGVLSRKLDIPVYADAECFEKMLPIIGKISARNLRVFEPDHEFYIKTLRVLPFSTPHDCAHPVGYAFMSGGKKVSVMTDVGHVTKAMLDAVENSDLLLIEANHDVDMLRAGSYPYPLKQRILGGNGHLCNEDSGLALVKLHAMGVKNAILGHLSNENNTPELALVTVKTVLEEAGILNDMFITVANRLHPTGVFEIA